MKYLSIVIVFIGLLLMAVPALVPVWFQAGVLLLGVFFAGFSMGGVWEAKRSAKQVEALRHQVEGVSSFDQPKV